MDDSDDYFDDLVLDEGTIAALDQVESQFAASQAFIPAPNRSPPLAATRRPEERPVKRQKTEHTPLVPLKRELSANDYDDLPEISIQGDSYYQVGAPQASQRGGVVYRPSDTQGRTSRPLQTRTSSTSSITRGNVPRPSQQLSRRSTGPASHAANVQPVSNPPRGLQRMSSTQQLYGPPSVPRATQSMSTDQKARRDAEILRVKLEELEKNQAELQRKLQEAEDVRYTKEGEINILRANITRTNDQHAAEVARLQAAREAAEAAKLQLQREQKEELERLKTHYTFRQHELETSTRKAPWSVSKKALRLEPNTPVKMPSQMRNWNTGNVPDFGSTQTPRRPRFGAIEKSLSQRPRQPAPFAEPTKKKPTLPGFHNSFFDTPSRPSSQRVADKGKGKQRAGSVNDNPFFTGHARSSPPSSPLAAHHEPLSDDTMDLVPAGPSNQSSPSSRSPPPVVVVDESGDADMKIVDENDPQDEIEDMDPPNWRDELHHIVFTHALLPDKTPTMQTLFNASLSSNATPEQCAKYSSACSHLLETLGSMTLPIIWEDHLHEITKVFADLARILTDNATIYPLSSLFSLLRILSYTIPSFSAALLTPSPNDTPPAILLILCDTICSYVAVSDMEGPREMHDVLAKESLLFVEALALTAPEELIPQLSTFIRSPQVLPVLLDKAQPTWLLTQTARTLGILASFGNLFRTFISLTLPVAGQDDASAKDTTQVWHIEQLCLYLTDATREGPEADQLRDHILTFLAILALSHSDTLVVLLRSHTLIPSIIMYLSNETEPFWEDDAALISSPPKLNRVLRIISRTIALLYYMVFSSPEPYRLNHKLHYTHHRQFYGIGHIFNVTMGRLSFADSPCWLNEPDRALYEQTVDMAKDLLELVMEGPELEDVWRAFQPDNEPIEIDDDDEEREARLLHPEDDN